MASAVAGDFFGNTDAGADYFLGISDIRIYKSRRAADSELNNFKQQIEVLQQQNAALKQGLGDVSQENFKEEKMRDQGYKKPGEEVWAIIGQNSQNTKISLHLKIIFGKIFSIK